MDSITQDEALLLFGDNFIGASQIAKVSDKTNLSLNSLTIPEIPFSKDFLHSLSGDYLLVLGLALDASHQPLTINSLRAFYGIDPDTHEPCFYNQDWYINEEFASKTTLQNKWYLIRKSITNESRGISPETLKKEIEDKQSFPQAILTVYTFFLYYFLNGQKLWEEDFIWCQDNDANGDQIYTGRYNDPKGINKNGFNIHRHLSIKQNYGLSPSYN